MLNDSLNTAPTNLVYLVLRKMPKETFNLHKQQNQPKALNPFYNNNNNQDVNGTNNNNNNGNFTKNVKMSLSKTNSSHQRNHSFSEIFLK